MTIPAKTQARTSTPCWLLIWLALAFAILSAPTQAGEVTYIYTDAQGTPLAEADADGNIIAQYDYMPYGAPVPSIGPAPNGPGYTGHVNDPDTGLVYMQARYYDPAVGRFLSVDPVGPTSGNTFNFNRYGYVNNNPIVNIDLDGRDCKTTGKMVNCSKVVTGSHIPVKFSFPAPAGFPSEINSSQSNYHDYDIPVSAGAGSAANADGLRRIVVSNPTPGADKPATRSGTKNNASPQVGSLGFVGKVKSSPVKSYMRTYEGHNIVVNVTLPGHPLFPGYAARIVTTANGVSTIHNVGEGLGYLQGKYSPFANMIDNAWIPISQGDINSTH